MGWLSGLVFSHAGWDATVGVVAGLALAAGLWAAGLWAAAPAAHRPGESRDVGCPSGPLDGRG